MKLEASSFSATRDSDGADVSTSFALNAAGTGTDSITEAPGGFDLAAGDFITLTYDVTILETIKDGGQQTNEVDIEWTSVNGTNVDERGGDGDPANLAAPANPNDYEDEDDTTFTANLTGYAFDKAIFTTSEAHTDSAEFNPSIPMSPSENWSLTR